MRRISFMLPIFALIISATHTAGAVEFDRALSAEFTALNSSGVSGGVQVFHRDATDEVVVTVTATGLEASRVHAQHIHGFADKSRNAVCPTIADDSDGDNLVAVNEGAGQYGPVLLSLEPFPAASNEGETAFAEIYTINIGNVEAKNLAVVLHGQTVGDSGYLETLPVACGRLVEDLDTR